MKANHTRYTTAIIIPIFNPHRVASVWDNIRENTKGEYHAYFLYPIALSMMPLIPSRGLTFIPYDPVEGNPYAQAINIGYRLTKETYVLIGSEDIGFYEKWLEYASKEMANGVEVIGLNPVEKIDPRTILVKRKFLKEFSGVVDTPNTLLCEEYEDESFALREFVETAKHRGVYSLSLSAKAAAVPPMWQRPAPPAPSDHDTELYKKRAWLWKGLQA